MWAAAANRAAAIRVLPYVSSPRTFSTSSYILEGDDGLVLVDAQFLPSAALDAVAHAEAATGKRVVLAVVLHANPDKFNGAAALEARGIRVLTSAQVAALIPAVHEKRFRWFGARYAPEYPTKAPALEVFGDRTRTLQVAGLTLRLHVLGQGASGAHVVLEHEGHVFVGDLVANGAHSWLELGDLDAWLARLDEIEALSPRSVHPGRGPSGGPELLSGQRRYLEQVRAAVWTAEAEGHSREEGIARARAALVAAFPGYGFEVFLRVGLPAVWDHEAARTAPVAHGAPRG
ncbi:MAG: MBL fold metallo-hydrolase [Myxococcota bacterium]